MAQHAKGSAASVNALVETIKNTCAADGWDVDYFITGRAHVHKGAHHFEVYTYSSVSLGLVACTGYSSGRSAINQPGASPVAFGAVLVSGYPILYQIVVTGFSFIGIFNRGSNNNPTCCQFGVIADKVGLWTGGQFVMSGPNVISTCQVWSSLCVANVYLGDQWTPSAMYGAGTGLYPSPLSLKQPNVFNGGILQLPIPIYLRNVSNSNLLHPIGYAPHVYGVSGGDVYLPGDTITIGGQAYLFAVSSAVATNQANIMFKLDS